MEITFSPNKKQDLVFEAFHDDTTTEIVYGGSAGGGKSYMLCSLIIMKALEYPGIRIGLARNELTTLKKTTVISFFEVANDWGISSVINYNSTAGIIKFDNGSEIVLLELAYKPSDSQFTRLGGHLLTFGVVDEIGEVDEKGYNIFKSRLGRWKNKEFNIKPICISTCNPIKNWLYREFYRKHVDGDIEPYKMFIQALPGDNPYLPESYIQNLMKLPYIERERLLNGNWEYESDPTALLEYQEILNIWDNVPEIKEDKPGKRYITADVAFTSDKMVIIIWDNLTIIDIIINPDGKVEDVILELAIKYKVPNYHIAYDSDGVGQFLKKRLTNAKPIINNAQAVNKENYKNLKTQLYFKLAELIKSNQIKNSITKHKEQVIEELQVIRHKPSETVGKLEMVDKGEVKRILGRSPDFSDAMAYRMYFEYKTVGVRTFRIG